MSNAEATGKGLLFIGIGLLATVIVSGKLLVPLIVMGIIAACGVAYANRLDQHDHRQRR
jgi:hypothetical protein